ncbi:septal ring lytic transglycosylase RlpA family protein [Poseidonibacter antarcticus]|uniref:septal ring lytic transglycosylase RlpA family protein n=1 Tax=Poseidonibacter antarcticus TaxID=2478538 RepID=UPI001D17EBEF|nr:septal ring lytic transglycosylase RlpA family protein [Poseidonibacter antarcticus]
MQYINKFLKYSLTSSFLIIVLLITGCSSKKGSVNTSDINRIYKSTSNNNIRNSKAMHRATLRPYSVFGERYYPFIANINDQFTGIASWYGPNFHAKKTSNGETYNMYDMTAAHKTLPMNTVLRVDNLENGKSVIVRVNDRGPFVDGRIIDLSNTAAHKIDMVRKGTARVKITVLGYNGEIQNYNAPVKQAHKEITKPKEITQVIKPMSPIKIEEKTIVYDNYNLQIGAFSKLNGAMITKRKYENMFNNQYKVDVVKVVSNNRFLHKVFIRGFNSRKQAEMFKDLNGLTSAIIIRK